MAIQTPVGQSWSAFYVRIGMPISRPTVAIRAAMQVRRSPVAGRS
jgi:hypothetical protein